MLQNCDICEKKFSPKNERMNSHILSLHEGKKPCEFAICKEGGYKEKYCSRIINAEDIYRKQILRNKMFLNGLGRV